MSRREALFGYVAVIDKKWSAAMAVPQIVMTVAKWLLATVGPVALQYLKDHPEIWKPVVDAMKKVVVRPTAGPKELAKTIGGLREQVAYLHESADDEGEVRRSEEWSRRLDKLEHLAAVLSDGASKNEVKALRQRVLAIRGEIVDAFVIEQAEDAEERKRIG